MMWNEQTLFQWIDLLWVPVAVLALHKGQRIKGVLFALACVFMLRLQIQLMESIGYPEGLLHIMDSPLYHRGLIAYGVVTGLYMILFYYSPRSDFFVNIAASIIIFIFAFCVSMGVMLL